MNREHIEDFNDHACRVREHMAGGESVDKPDAAQIAKINLDIMEQMHDELECRYEAMSSNEVVARVDVELSPQEINKLGDTTTGQVVAATQPQLPGQSIDEILANSDPHDHNQWQDVGKALFKHYGPGPTGLSKWVQWSAKHGHHPGDEYIESRWREMALEAANDGGSSV